MDQKPFRSWTIPASLDSLLFIVGSNTVGYDSQWNCSPSSSGSSIGLSGFERVVVASLLASEFDDLKQRGFEFDSNSESKLPKQSLAARWKYGWQENTVSVELIAPIAQWEKPYEEMDSHEKKRTVALRESDWPWYDCRQTNALGGDSYLLQCCLSDSLRPAETTSKLSESSWPLFDKLSPSLADEPWLYEIRIACEPGFALSIDQKQQLERFFNSVRSELRQSLKANMIREAVIGSSK